MSDDDFGCQFTNSKTTLFLTSVEEEFLGLSLTERDGLDMRRVTIELHEVEQITVLRDTLSAFLERKGKA